MKHCGRDERTCLFIGCNCLCDACVEVKVANGSMDANWKDKTMGGTTDYDLRASLLRSLNDTRTQIDNVERLLRERDHIINRVTHIAAVLRSDTAVLLDGKPRSNLEKTIRQLDELVSDLKR